MGPLHVKIIRKCLAATILEFWILALNCCSTKLELESAIQNIAVDPAPY